MSEKRELLKLLDGLQNELQSRAHKYRADALAANQSRVCYFLCFVSASIALAKISGP
jgi:hypothetical protein